MRLYKFIRVILAAWASPSRLALHARGLRCALAAHATCLQLGLCPCGSRCALTARLHRLRKKIKITLCMNSYYTICIKIVWIRTKTTNNCMNSCVWIHTKTTLCMNSYFTICIQFVQYKLCCTNSYYTICMIKKQNKNSHGIPTHALIQQNLTPTS